MSSPPNSDTRTEQLRRRNRELSILNTIAEALNREVDLTRALDTTLIEVISLLGLNTGWIWLLHERTGESYLAAQHNLPLALANDLRRMEGDCYCLRTYREGDLAGAANVNVVACSRLNGLVDGTDGFDATPASLFTLPATSGWAFSTSLAPTGASYRVMISESYTLLAIC